MGAADSVPGVSGGTIALITGIYERLITAITSLDPRVLAHVPRLHTRDGRRALWDDLVAMDIGFLVALGLGVVSALVVVSRVVQFALATARGPTFAFFFGLIAASALVLFGEVTVSSASRAAIAVVGFAIAFWVSGVTQSSGLPNSPAFVFVAGMIAITAMILPGISGAFFLLLLGQYDYLTGTLTTFTNDAAGLLDGGHLAALVQPGTTILAFALGAVVGVVTIAHVIKWALATYRGATLIFLVSLMVGALRLPAQEAIQSTGTWTPLVAGGTVLAALVGAGSVLLLDRYTDDLDY
ncbi:MAG: DUF368 domain-containing protein [Halorientalis sp.]